MHKIPATLTFFTRRPTVLISRSYYVYGLMKKAISTSVTVHSGVSRPCTAIGGHGGRIRSRYSKKGTCGCFNSNLINKPLYFHIDATLLSNKDSTKNLPCNPCPKSTPAPPPCPQPSLPPCDPCKTCAPCTPCNPCKPCAPPKPIDPCKPVELCRPFDPCKPSDPNAPCLPCDPCKPCPPCNPCRPCGLCKPCGPCGPCVPCNPCGPCSPCGPCGPCNPCSPCNPCAPCLPCAPCTPCAPCMPCAPCNPCLRMRGTKENLLNAIHKISSEDNSRKVTVVGAGNVGMAAVVAMLCQGVSNNIAIVDNNSEKLKGEELDLMHGAQFINAKVTSSTDFSISAGSNVCIITAGVRQKDNEAPLDLIQRNTDVLKEIIPEMVKHSPDTIFLLVTNPVDVLTYVTWKISKLPKHKIIGTGTLIDSARFRYLVSQRLGIAPPSVQGYIIGEHGKSMVPVWSSVNIGGARLCDVNPFIGTECDPEQWRDIHCTLLTTAQNIKSLKGFTNWAIAMAISHTVKSIMTNSNEIFCLSTFVQGHHDVTDEVFLSLPACVCSEGIKDVIRLNLAYAEYEAFLKSARAIAELQAGIKF